MNDIKLNTKEKLNSNNSIMDSFLENSSENNFSKKIKSKKSGLRKKILFTTTLVFFLSLVLLNIYDFHHVFHGVLFLLYVYMNTAFIDENNITNFDESRELFFEYLIEKYGDKKDKKELYNILSLKYKIYSFVNNLPKKPSYIKTFSFNHKENYLLLKEIYNKHYSAGNVDLKTDKLNLFEKINIMYKDFIFSKVENIITKTTFKTKDLVNMEHQLIKLNSKKKKSRYNYFFYHYGLLKYLNDDSIDFNLEKEKGFIEYYWRKEFHKVNLDMNNEEDVFILNSIFKILLNKNDIESALKSLNDISNIFKSVSQKALLEEKVKEYYKEKDFYLKKDKVNNYKEFLKDEVN